MAKWGRAGNMQHDAGRAPPYQHFSNMDSFLSVSFAVCREKHGSPQQVYTGETSEVHFAHGHHCRRAINSTFI